MSGLEIFYIWMGAGAVVMALLAASRPMLRNRVNAILLQYPVGPVWAVLIIIGLVLLGALLWPISLLQFGGRAGTAQVGGRTGRQMRRMASGKPNRQERRAQYREQHNQTRRNAQTRRR